MLKPLDRHRRDSTLFQFTSRRMRDFIDPDHLLVRIDEQFDFTKPATPLKDRYCPGNRRPAIHPEVMIRALIICSLYNIPSFGSGPPGCRRQSSRQHNWRQGGYDFISSLNHPLTDSAAPAGMNG